MIIEGNHIIAEHDKILRRIEDHQVVGEECYLGYTYYIGGKRLDTPKIEVPSDYEEVTQDEIDREIRELYPPLVEKYIRERYSISDELAVQRQREEKKDIFREYYYYCEECKHRAKQELGL